MVAATTSTWSDFTTCLLWHNVVLATPRRENDFLQRFPYLQHPSAPQYSLSPYAGNRGDRALSHRRADPTQRGVLVTAVRRLRMMGVPPGQKSGPTPCG